MLTLPQVGHLCIVFGKFLYRYVGAPGPPQNKRDEFILLRTGVDVVSFVRLQTLLEWLCEVI
jgi:hypothetical protein